MYRKTNHPKWIGGKNANSKPLDLTEPNFVLLICERLEE